MGVNNRKINTRVSAVDHNRLLYIKSEYRFKSVSEILKYVIHCFLRVADPVNDNQVELLPDEIRDMFEGLEDRTEFKQPCVSKYSKSLNDE